jgi:hypothetical protein
MALVAVFGMTGTIASVAVRPAEAGTVLVPRLSATPSTVRPGDSVTVSAYDLASLTDYQVQLCGNDGFGSSAVCNLTSSTIAATSEIGHFVVVLRVLPPPMPCPCVVKAMPLQGSVGLVYQEVSTPITILGVHMANPVPPAVNENPSGLVVDRADLVGTRSWAEWFGDSPHRTLVLKLRDAGANLIPSTPFVLRAGPAGHPTEIISAPLVPPLYPGQVVSYRVPVTFPILAHGNYVVVGTLGNAGQTVTFRATASLMPWGLVVLLAMVVLVALGLVLWRVLKRRRSPTADVSIGTTPPGGSPPAGTEAPATADEPNSGDWTDETPLSPTSSSNAEPAGKS